MPTGLRCPCSASALLPPALLLSLFGAIAVAHVLFQKKLTFTRTEKEIQAERDKLEQLGLLVHQSFRALRAFQLEEFEDEGSQYFLELEDHSVFYLSGQFLYEYEPPTIGPVDSPARNLRFAATRKTAISFIFFVRGESWSLR